MPVEERKYTFAEVSEWEGKWELVDGVPYAMASPSVQHQRSARKLLSKLDRYLDGKRCEPFHELAVRLYDDYEDYYIPDIIVVCDPDKIKENFVAGAPDMVIEVLSPSNTMEEMYKKLGLYSKAGVREYWVVDPLKKQIAVYFFESSPFIPDVYTEGSVKVNVLDDLTINLKEVFAE